MRIEQLEIENFRAIEKVIIDARSTMVVIAGPNGCGKSCVLDGIRFVKSTYGGYGPNEWDQWLGEFQIDRQREPWEMKKLLRDKSRDAKIAITLTLHDRERQYLQNNKHAIAEEIAINQINPGLAYRDWRQRIRVLGEQRQQMFVREVTILTKDFAGEMDRELKNNQHSGAVEIRQDGQIVITRNMVLEGIWRIYEPQHVGLVDYHGSHRHYAREQLGGVNLNLRTQEEQQKQSTLYNYANKYANIKTQMATEFVLQTLREKGGNPWREPLTETLKELFQRFFPGKGFDGVKTNDKGELEFAVTVGNKQKHDINDLSSGEKEILFGYLRLRNSAQRQSIILLDEPELHLNPKLIRGLPQFYQKHIGDALENQIWTVTHSDAFLREAIGSTDTKVYHMKEVNTEETGGNQVHEIKKEEEGEEAVLEMIGDIAGYRPGGKIVIFEGENSELDVKMTGRLFPEFEREMNFLSGGNKVTVRRLHQALEAQEGTKGKGRIFSIVDRDDETEKLERKNRAGQFMWDAYHIENYLLDASMIMEVLQKSTLSETSLTKVDEIEVTLKGIARKQVEDLVEHAVRAKAHRAISSTIKLKGRRKTEGAEEDAGKLVSKRVAKAIDKLKNCLNSELSATELNRIADTRRAELKKALETEDWKKEFPGREILKEFTKKHGGMRYETMRNLIINTMTDRGIQPPGMLSVLEQIDKWKPR